jgi:hypothetical protein
LRLCGAFACGTSLGLDIVEGMLNLSRYVSAGSINAAETPNVNPTGENHA